MAPSWAAIKALWISVDRKAITVRYVVPWDAKAKGPSPALAEVLKGLEVGDKVMVAWGANAERVWLKQVKLVSRAGAKKGDKGK